MVLAAGMTRARCAPMQQVIVSMASATLWGTYMSGYRTSGTMTITAHLETAAPGEQMLIMDRSASYAAVSGIGVVSICV
jgi:hypothetical protein